MKIVNFWDIGAWKEARKLTRMVYGFTREGDFSLEHL